MSLRNKLKSRKQESGEIPMAAMPDIAFLLLVFFMVSTTFLVSRTLPVELPAYSQETSERRMRHLKVNLATDSMRVEFGDDKQTMELWELNGYVRSAMASAGDESEKVVLLQVDDSCPYQRVVKAFDHIRSAGGYVSLVETE